MRRLIFVLVGAVLFFYGMILLQSARSGLTLGKPAIWLVVVGTGMGALLGFLLAELTRPSAKPQTGPLVLGGVGGLLLGIVYGLFTVDEGCVGGGIDPERCGWTFSGWWVFRSGWTSLALWAVFGGVLGASLAWVAARLVRGRDASLPADAGSA